MPFIKVEFDFILVGHEHVFIALIEFFVEFVNLAVVVEHRDVDKKANEFQVKFY